MRIGKTMRTCVQLSEIAQSRSTETPGKSKNRINIIFPTCVSFEGHTPLKHNYSLEF